MSVRKPAAPFGLRGTRSLVRGLLCASALIPAAVSAQTTTATDDVVVLDEIVVTAAGFEQLLKDAPASISVITGEQLAKGNVTSLTDALKGVQGVVTTGIANESDIFIRGMPGAYTLILVDGKRQSTRDARTNGNAGFEQSFIPPVSAIERIEVVRGPMSSLYGSDAMGGVINIITKKVSPVWGGEVTVDTILAEGPETGDKRQLSFYLNGPIVADKLGLQIWGRKMKRDAANSTDGMNESDEYDVSARLTWTPTDNQEIQLEGGKTQVDNKAFGSTSYTENSRDHLALTHKGDWAFGTSEISLSREWGQRTPIGSTTTRAPEIRNTVLDAKLNTQLGANAQHNLTFGGQFFRADLFDQNPGMNTGLVEHFQADQYAVFLEDEWKLTPDFALTMGLRYNDHEEYSGHFTPRLYGVWSASDQLTVKGGISTGFRAPDIRSITPGYAYTTGGGNCRATKTCGVIIADPNLKPESSTSFELATLWEAENYNLGATVFYTRFKDKIENYLTSPVEYWTGPQYVANDGTLNSYRIWYNRNVSRATIKGLELTGDWDISSTLSVRANYTYTDSSQDTGAYAGFPLARTPEHMANLRLDWMTPVDGLDAWASANYHGSEIASGARIGTNGTPITINGVAGRKYAGYRTVDLGVDYAYNDKVNISAAVYNVFDHRVEVADSNTTIDGRRLWLAVTTRF